MHCPCPALPLPTSPRSLWTSRPLASELRQQAVLEVVHLAALWTGLMTRLAALPQQLSQAAGARGSERRKGRID